MLYLTCTTITVGLAHYGVSRAKDWVSGACGTKYNVLIASLLSNFIAERGTRTETFLWRDLSLFFFFFFFFFFQNTLFLLLCQLEKLIIRQTCINIISEGCIGFIMTCAATIFPTCWTVKTLI